MVDRAKTARDYANKLRNDIDCLKQIHRELGSIMDHVQWPKRIHRELGSMIEHVQCLKRIHRELGSMIKHVQQHAAGLDAEAVGMGADIEYYENEMIDNYKEMP